MLNFHYPVPHHHVSLKNIFLAAAFFIAPLTSVSATPFGFTDDFTGGIGAPWSLSANIPDQLPNWSTTPTTDGTVIAFTPSTPRPDAFVRLTAERALPKLTGAFDATASASFQRDPANPLLASQVFRIALFTGSDVLAFYQANAHRVSATGDPRFGMNFGAHTKESSPGRSDDFNVNEMRPELVSGRIDVAMTRNALNDLVIEWSVFDGAGNKYQQVGSNYVVNNAAGIPTSSFTGEAIGDVTSVRISFLTFSSDTTAFAPADFEEMTLTGFAISGEAADAVPEPGTLALFGAGLIGLAALRRRYTTSSSRLVVSP